MRLVQWRERKVSIPRDRRQSPRLLQHLEPPLQTQLGGEESTNQLHPEPSNFPERDLLFNMHRVSKENSLKRTEVNMTTDTSQPDQTGTLSLILLHVFKLNKIKR